MMLTKKIDRGRTRKMDSDKQGIAVTARYYFRRYLMLAFGMFMLGVVGGAVLALNGHDLRALAPLLQ